MPEFSSTVIPTRSWPPFTRRSGTRAGSDFRCRDLSQTTFIWNTGESSLRMLSSDIESTEGRRNPSGYRELKRMVRKVSREDIRFIIMGMFANTSMGRVLAIRGRYGTLPI